MNPETYLKDTGKGYSTLFRNNSPCVCPFKNALLIQGVNQLQQPVATIQQFTCDTNCPHMEVTETKKANPKSATKADNGQRFSVTLHCSGKERVFEDVEEVAQTVSNNGNIHLVK